jgi:uncharacterized tellurite resistance protein B-like protein
MLLDAIKALIKGDADEGEAGGPHEQATDTADAPPGVGPVDPVHLAACTLLLEVAHADGEFTEDERAHLEGVLERHFQLPPSAGRRLMEAADEERRAAIDHYSFTSVMWGLVLADGVVAEHERYLTRKIANLLDLKPGYLSAAKKNAGG